MNTRLSYAELEARIHIWAQGQEDVAYILVVGSRARLDPGPDAWSDLDLVLLTRNLQRYTQNSEWLSQFGEVWLAHLYPDEHGAEWQVLYEDGLKVDFYLFPIPPGEELPLESLLARFPYPGVLSRGARLLGRSEHLPGRSAGSPALPTPQAFNTFLSEWLFDCLRAARLIARGETWQAYHQLNCRLHDGLLKLIQWHSHIVHPEAMDAWYHGRFIKHWADPEVLAHLPETFSRYDEAEMTRALQATLELGWSLAQVVSPATGAGLPEEEYRHTSGWIRSVLGFQN